MAGVDQTLDMVGNQFVVERARMKSFEQALTRWEKALGSHYVVTDPLELGGAETATYATTQRIPAILHPGSREEVQACVVIAQEAGIPVYPISGGKNWGYGSRVPVQDGSVVIDLGRLNRIIDYDEELAYVTVEPGVTPRQLFRFLREQKSDLLLSATGSSPDASVIGNVLERGIGTGPYADRLSSVCNFEVVLPTGRCIRTGFGRFDGAAAPVHRWGVGPYVDGLFTQSNIGIVTQMTTWLLPCPEYFVLAYYTLENQSQLAPLMDALRRLMLQGVVRPAAALFNDDRILSFFRQYPWEEAESLTPMPDDVRQKLRRSPQFGFSIGAWNGEIGLHAADRTLAEAQRAVIERSLKDLTSTWTILEATGAELRDLLAHPDAPPRSGAGSDMLRDALLRKHLGIPLEGTALQTYWRKRAPFPSDMDPDRDRCGLIWCSPVVPFTSDHIERAVGIIADTTRRYAYEPTMSLQCTSERSVTIIVSIHYDRDLPGEDAKAVECFNSLSSALEQSGYFSYRHPTLSMTDATDNVEFQQFLMALKQAVDPHDILAPGRYIQPSASARR